MSDWEEFFDRFGDYVFTVGFYESKQSLSVEELYQAFKERLAAEQKEGER